jgi:putative transposase
MLYVNTLLEWQYEDDGELQRRIERVLWIDPSGADVVTIELFTARALPIFQKQKEIEKALEGQQAKVLEHDPYASLRRPEASIPDKHRQRRDEAWEIIRLLVENNGDQIFFPRKRGPLLRAVEQATGRSKMSLYKYLRRYWQGGQTKNALLPLFDRCGGKGKERKSSGRKRGRPAKLSQVTGSIEGVNITPEIRTKFQKGIRLFYENKQECTLADAFQKTLEKFFHKGYELSPDGVLIPCLPPANELPTLGQFRYWYEKERNVIQSISKRKGKRRYDLSHREILGDSTQMAFGPGSLYQIDATIGDIYLVSSLDRTRIIGRPVIYVVIDVFSRMIVGLNVGLKDQTGLEPCSLLPMLRVIKWAFVLNTILKSLKRTGRAVISLKRF